MGDVSGKTKVNFPAYCEAFSVIERWNGEVCGALDPGGDEHSVETMHREGAGDGYVRVPSYRVVRGKFDASGSVWLKEDGSVFRDDGTGNTQGLSGVDAEKAGYFIAGAFGAEELSDSRYLDGYIISGLRELYRQCIKNISTCLEGPDAKALAARWSALQNSRQELESKKSHVAELWREYDALVSKVQEQGALAMQTTMIGNSLPRNPVTMEECDRVARGLSQLIATAKGVVEAAQRRASEEQTSREIASINARTSVMIPQVEEEEPALMSRFTDAVAAGISCMPTPSTIEEELCVAKNKNTMVSKILTCASAWPRTGYCASGHTENSAGHISCGGGRGDGDCSSGEGSSMYVCDQEVEYDYCDGDAGELMQAARSYCTTICR